MAKTFSFPLYRAVIVETGKTIAGPSTDCLRMNLAASSFAVFEGVATRTEWVKTLTPAEAIIFNGKGE